MKNEPKRTCAAIMFSDIVGYTALMGEDQELAFQLVKKNSKFHQEVIKIHYGKLIKELGDGVLCSFPKAEDSVAAAYELQQHYFKSKELSLRIGIHYGEVILDRHDVFGDAVNIASRLQTLGSPGSVLFSHKIREDIDENSSLKSVSLGKFKLKNVKEPLEVFALANAGLIIPKRGEILKLLESRLKKFMLGGLILLTLALVGFGVYHQTSINKLMAEPEKSIAVLPFFDEESSLVNDSLNLNLTDNLITNLSKISSFIVIDSVSSRQFDVKKFSIKTISNKLRAKYLVVGNTMGKGDTRKVNLKMFDGENEEMLWTEDFEIGYDMFSALELNRQIILQISDLLGVKLSVSELENLNSNPTENTDAYRAYLTGRNKFQKYEASANQEAISQFRKALKLSPKFKEAYQGLADAYVQNHYYSPEDFFWLDSSIFYSNLALQLDNTYSDAHLSLGSASYYKVEYSKAIDYFKKAISFNGNNYRALANLGSTLMVLGKVDSSLFYLDQSAKLNPQSFISLQAVGWNYRLLKDYQNAVCWLEESIKLKPSIDAYEQLAYSYVGLNDIQTAKEIAGKILNLKEEEKSKREIAGMIYFLCRDFESAYYNFDLAYLSDQALINCGTNRMVIYLGYLESIVKENKFKSEILVDGCRVYLESKIKQGSQDVDNFFGEAIYYAIKGDIKNCLESLESAKQHYWVDVIFVSQNPVFDVFKDHPDFVKFISNQNQTIDSKQRNAKKINHRNLDSGDSSLSICYK